MIRNDKVLSNVRERSEKDLNEKTQSWYIELR